MKTRDLPDPEAVEQVAKLLAQGGAAKHLEACDCLMQSLPVTAGTRGQRVRALKAMLEEALTPDSGDPELLAAREYLGWVPHTYDEVIEAAGKTELSSVTRLGAGASEDEKQAHRDDLLSYLAVREVFVGQRLRPRQGMSVRAVLGKRPLIAKAVLRAVADFLDDPSQLEVLTHSVQTGAADLTKTAREQHRSENREIEAISTSSDGVERLFTTIESETLFYISDTFRTIHVNRRIRSEVDSLDIFTAYFSGAGHRKIEYHFDAEYGCLVDERSVERYRFGGLSARFRLSRTLNRGDEHTIRYVIRRRDPDNDWRGSNTWVESLYTDEAPTLRERMLVYFPSFQPAHVWRQVTGNSYRIPSRWSEDQSLSLDAGGCAEWEIDNMKPNLHYVICWAHGGPMRIAPLALYKNHSEYAGLSWTETSDSFQLDEWDQLEEGSSHESI
jgi:hypothetical protein